MNRMGKKMIVLLLALSMLLSLAACGKDGGNDESNDSQQLSGTVYVPQYIDLDLGKNMNIQGGCTDGKNVYLLTAKHPDYEAGEEGDTVYSVQKVSLDGGEITPLENFKPDTALEGYDQSYAYYDGIRAGTDGTVWVTVGVSAYTYDLPENFDPETDQVWNYDIKDSVDTQYQVQLDSTGAEITRVETGDLFEKAGVENRYSDGVAYDGDGNIYVSDDGRIVVMDSSMNVLFEVKDESIRGGNTVTLSDGRVACAVTVADSLNENYSRQLKVIDLEAKDWGESIDIPSSVYNMYPGAGEYLFYYEQGELLYGYKAEPAEGEDPSVRLLSWLEADMAVDDLEFFTFLEDGRLVVMARAWGDGLSGSSENLAVLTPTDRSTLPEKTTLTYATMYLNQNDRNRIIEFNRTSTTHRIEVKDYSEFNTEDDYQAGIKKLNTEILAGQVPDLISTDNLPIRQYGAKGILEGLWPYIEGDSEIGGKAGLMDRVFTAVEQEGKLYQIFSSFGINTLAGAPSVVGDRNSWTISDLKAALATMPEGCSLLAQYNTKSDMLNTVVGLNLDSFVDWNTGECRFDSQEFKDLLEFCNSFPVEFDWESVDWENYQDETTRMANGAQMLSRVYLSDFTELQMYKKVLDGDVTYVGYPMEDGSVGSTFYTNGGLAMSSSCKDKEGAWSFMRTMLLPRYVGTEIRGGMGMGSGFPSNKADFEWVADQARIPAGYETDENGNQVLDEDGNPIETSNSGWSWGSVSVDIMSMKDDEYNQIMALYNSVERMSNYDSNINEIVNDGAGPYFAGDKSLDDVAAQIQSRVKLYVDENR